MSLKHYFLIALSLSMGALGVFFAILLSMNLRDQLVTETEHKASLVLSQAEAIQAYVREVLRPAMYTILHSDDFVLEAMSTSYVTRSIMTDLGLKDDQIRYRRVAIGARNPDFEANAFERELIDRFAADPTLIRIEELTEYAGEEIFLAARPVRLTDSCLHCHGNPAQAPKALLERYGDSRGFWRHSGELVGLDLVIVPVGWALGQIKGKTLGFLSLFALGLGGFYLTIHIFFDRLVVDNLRRVIDVLRHHFPHEAIPPSPSAHSPTKSNEIEEIYAGIDALASRLKDAHQHIEDYTRNLESMVATRTQELTLEARERRADVALFVDLLQTIAAAPTNTELLRLALPQIAQRFGADWVFYQCGSGIGSFLWPQDTPVPLHPEHYQNLIASGELVILENEVLIPVRTTDIGRGILHLHFPKSTPHPMVHGEELYQAIGHQLALALENLEAIHSLMAHNALLESIFNGISDPLALVDTTFSLILANEPARQLARSLADQAPDTTELQLPAWIFHTPDSLSDIDPNAPGVSSITLKDGRSFVVARYPIPSAPEQAQRFVVYARENTAERRMVERLVHSERMVTVGRLAAGLAHEVNNPLGVILCYTELLRHSITDPGCLEDIAIIERHATMAKKVVRDLLDFARPRPAQIAPCNLTELLTNLTRIFEVQAQSRHVTLEMDLPPEPVLALADTSALEQVLSNIVLNALDAVPAQHGRITIQVRTQEEGGGAVITVADNGPGIPEAILPHIFDPFFSTKEVGQGTGLGLAVAFGLMRDMNGSIEAHNAGGAVFVLTLPPCPATPPQEGA